MGKKKYFQLETPCFFASASGRLGPALVAVPGAPDFHRKSSNGGFIMFNSD
jgi:hypothetical protein